VDSPQARYAAIEADGLTIRPERELQAASLRYFDSAGSFAATVREMIGRPLPPPLRAIQLDDATRDAYLILVWRSPTEILLLSKGHGRDRFAELEQHMAGAVDGCMVNQTGGLCLLRAQGTKVRDLLLRLGAATAIPGLGEARCGRMAELQVLTACVQEGEFLLLVERVYADHLLQWIGVTVADL
jgi:sarcosine oxidase gamma subunit